MDVLIHPLCHSLIILRLGKGGEFFEPCVDGRCTMIVYTTFIAKDTRLHVVEVILAGLLKGRVIAFLLQFLGLEIVAGVVLVADGQGHDIEFLKVTTHRQHLQHSFLGTVVGVLCPTLALRQPDVLLLLCHSEMDVTAHKL